MAEAKDFQSRWSELLLEDDKEQETELQELLGIDAYSAHPRPISMYSRSRYEASATLARNRTGFNLLFDRELNRVKNQRENLHTFLSEQQRWLIQMKSDLTSCRFYYPKQNAKFNNFMLSNNISASYEAGAAGANESLAGLRNNLSELIN